jgi:hypothetical protein
MDDYDKKEIGKATRALKKQGMENPTTENIVSALDYFRPLGMNPLEKTSTYLAKVLKASESGTAVPPRGG